jgi:hypothetical protein
MSKLCQRLQYRYENGCNVHRFTLNCLTLNCDPIRSTVTLHTANSEEFCDAVTFTQPPGGARACTALVPMGVSASLVSSFCIINKLPWQHPRVFTFCPEPCDYCILLHSASGHSLSFLPRPDVTDGLNNAIMMSPIVSRLTMILLPLFALLLSHNVRAQDFFPSAIPLAVRSPYLNCWLQSGSATTPLFGSTWPTNFNNSQVCYPYI